MELSILKGQLFGAVTGLWSSKTGALLAAVATALTKYFDACSEAVQKAAFAALIFFIVDTVLGVTNAVAGGKVSSSGFGRGIIKFLVYLGVVAMGVAVDTLMGWQHMAPLFILYWIAAREGISAVENANELGFPLPGWLKKILEQYQAVADEGPEGK